ncbi:hypothetical protein BJ912DRAFT_1062968 [Pholiota molesta]|nr:hypothetical protein BJ912DRAFT_1062968 [Pholiota molesta]
MCPPAFSRSPDHWLIPAPPAVLPLWRSVPGGRRFFFLAVAPYLHPVLDLLPDAPVPPYVFPVARPLADPPTASGAVVGCGGPSANQHPPNTFLIRFTNSTDPPTFGGSA